MRKCHDVEQKIGLCQIQNHVGRNVSNTSLEMLWSAISCNFCL
ncbi:unnamed protein product [Gongylonema pulchrum]|uniref:Uncharacterized protein n=1 Tax=Gongylonema pulchrum TaxID=637853 RepID=A0A3P7S4S4_9BILA|nr:unnamed protein product [Gongylonema pulchrum]